jgi:hypothetical protein
MQYAQGAPVAPATPHIGIALHRFRQTGDELPRCSAAVYVDRKHRERVIACESIPGLLAIATYCTAKDLDR